MKYLEIAFFDAAGREIAAISTFEKDTQKARAAYKRYMKDPILKADYPECHHYIFRGVA